MKKLLVVLMAMMMLTACASMKKEEAKIEGKMEGTKAEASDSGFLGQYYSKLQPGGEGEAKLRWLKPGADFAKYKKIMFDYPIFAFAKDSEYKGINADEMKKIADEAALAFVDAVKKDFPVVSEPGPDVLRVRVAIVDLKQSYPVLSGVTSVVPMGLAISIVKKGVTNSWTGSGATTAQMLAIDSMTTEVLAAAQDEYSAGFTERFTKWGSVNDAFKYWGELFDKRLNILIHGN